MHAAAVLFLPFRALVFTREFQLLFDEFWPRIYGPVDVPRSDRVVSEIQLVVENPFRVCLACGRTTVPVDGYPLANCCDARSVSVATAISAASA
jgi:hypothetical protein